MAYTVTQALMMHPSNTLHQPGKLHAGKVSSGGGFQVFGGAELGKHLPLNAAFLCPGSYPARLVAGSIRIALQADVVLLVSAQLLRQLPHHALARRWFQICQQRCQPGIDFLQFIHDSPSTSLLVLLALAPS